MKKIEQRHIDSVVNSIDLLSAQFDGLEDKRQIKEMEETQGDLYELLDMLHKERERQVRDSIRRKAKKIADKLYPNY